MPPWLPDEIDKGVASNCVAEPSNDCLDKEAAIRAWRDRPGAWRFSNSMRNAVLLEAVRVDNGHLFWADRVIVTAFGIGERVLSGMRSGAWGQYAAFHDERKALTAATHFDCAFGQMADKYYSRFTFDLLHDAAEQTKIGTIGADELTAVGTKLRRSERFLTAGRDIR